MKQQASIATGAPTPLIPITNFEDAEYYGEISVSGWSFGLRSYGGRAYEGWEESGKEAGRRVS